MFNDLFDLTWLFKLTTVQYLYAISIDAKKKTH